ncbi:unnamed protein product [Rhizopus stolonifer]
MVTKWIQEQLSYDLPLMNSGSSTKIKSSTITSLIDKLIMKIICKKYTQGAEPQVPKVQRHQEIRSRSPIKMLWRPIALFFLTTAPFHQY